MPMTVFISHKKEDSIIAGYICNELRKLGVNSYLDILEGDLLLHGEKLTNHIKQRLNNCTDLLAVMSDKTQESWWVPVEIGMAAQRDFPIVSYLVNKVQLPEYLSYWPTLRQTTDLHKYVKAKEKALLETATIQKSYNMYGVPAPSSTETFYKNLRSML